MPLQVDVTDEISEGEALYSPLKYGQDGEFKANIVYSFNPSYHKLSKILSWDADFLNMPKAADYSDFSDQERKGIRKIENWINKISQTTTVQNREESDVAIEESDSSKGCRPFPN